MVNVVDLMRLQPATEHPHGLSDAEFDALFTTDKPVIFAYHGYPWLIHRLTYRRHGHDNLHVRGYKEEGTTTTPFDMVMLNDLDRFHLVMDVIDRVPGLAPAAGHLRQLMVDARIVPRLHPRARRGPAGDPRLDLALLTAAGRAGLAVRVLVVNAGSSSLKLSVLSAEGECGPPQPWSDGGPQRRRARPSEAVQGFLDRAGADRRGIGHRVVHGGSPLHPGRPPIDDGLISYLESRSRTSRRCTTHRAARGDPAPSPTCCHRFPPSPCFDTAFHERCPQPRATYALPREWNERWGLRRYGFHGLSHAYRGAAGCRTRRPDSAGSQGVRVLSPRGAGASLAAVRDGRLSGHDDELPAGRRAGDGHPVRRRSTGAPAVAGRARRHASGGTGRHSGTPFWLGWSCRYRGHARGGDRGRGRGAGRAARTGGLPAPAAGGHRGHDSRGLGGLDVLAFTGGVGENSPEVRAGAAAGLGFLGVGLDPARNASGDEPTGTSGTAAPGSGRS